MCPILKEGSGLWDASRAALIMHTCVTDYADGEWLAESQLTSSYVCDIWDARLTDLRSMPCYCDLVAAIQPRKIQHITHTWLDNVVPFELFNGTIDSLTCTTVHTARWVTIDSRFLRRQQLSSFMRRCGLNSMDRNDSQTRKAIRYFSTQWQSTRLTYELNLVASALHWDTIH